MALKLGNDVILARGHLERPRGTSMILVGRTRRRQRRRAEVPEEHEAGDAIGTVTPWYAHLSVAAIRLTAPLAVGDRIHIKGHTTDLVETVSSMEIDRRRVEQAGPGDDVALAVEGHVRDHDVIFREA
jgi:putative protease